MPNPEKVTIEMSQGLFDATFRHADVACCIECGLWMEDDEGVQVPSDPQEYLVVCGDTCLAFHLKAAGGLNYVVSEVESASAPYHGDRGG